MYINTHPHSYLYTISILYLYMSGSNNIFLLPYLLKGSLESLNYMCYNHSLNIENSLVACYL